MKLRRMHRDDALGVARVHVETWRAAYRGLVPRPYLDALNVAEDAWGWRERIERWPAGVQGWVAENPDREIVAIATGGPDRRLDVAGAGELYCLYVLPCVQGRGLGQRLCERVAVSLIAEGVTCLRIWVLTENHAARRFYENLGGTETQTVDFELGGARLLETAYEWSDISALLLRSS